MRPRTRLRDPQPRPSGPPGRCGVPAAQRRPSSAVAWLGNCRAATTLLGRRRPASEPGEQTSSTIPGEPGIDLVRSGKRRRDVDLAQSHARHPEVGRFPACSGRLRSRKLKRTEPNWGLRNLEVGRGTLGFRWIDDVGHPDDPGDTCAIPVWVIGEVFHPPDEIDGKRMAKGAAAARSWHGRRRRG